MLIKSNILIFSLFLVLCIVTAVAVSLLSAKYGATSLRFSALGRLRLKIMNLRPT